MRRRQGRILIGCGNLRNRLFGNITLSLRLCGFAPCRRFRTILFLIAYIILIQKILARALCVGECGGLTPPCPATRTRTATKPKILPGRGRKSAEENFTTKNTKKQAVSALRRKLPKIFERGNTTDPLDRGCISRFISSSLRNVSLLFQRITCLLLTFILIRV